jgi:hypothetical protein
VHSIVVAVATAVGADFMGAVAASTVVAAVPAEEVVSMEAGVSEVEVLSTATEVFAVEVPFMVMEDSVAAAHSEVVVVSEEMQEFAEAQPIAVHLPALTWLIAAGLV